MRNLAASLLSIVVATSNFPEALAQTSSICGLAPGQQARISEIRARDGTASVDVERAGRSYHVQANCLIQGGDIVRPRAGSTVTVVTPSGESVEADVDHPYAVPASTPGSRWTDLYQALKSYIGDDIAMANSMANVKLAQGRALDRVDEAAPVIIPGLLASTHQNVTSNRPLLLRWLGGSGPYSIKLQSGEASTAKSWATLAHAFDLPVLSPGNYTLTISCASCTALNVQLHAAPESDVPSSPDIRRLAPEDRSGAEAVWLLTQSGNEWRLEALSRLQSRARDHGDVVAQAILAQTAP